MRIGVVGDFDIYRVRIHEGPHAGHTAEIWIASHNCGATQIDIICECSSVYFNEMRGCWQFCHAREEEGDPSLRVALDLISQEG